MYLDAFVLTERNAKRPRIHFPWTHSSKLEENTASGTNSKPENVGEYGWAKFGILVVAGVLVPLAVYTGRLYFSSTILRLDETERLNEEQWVGAGGLSKSSGQFGKSLGICRTAE